MTTSIPPTEGSAGVGPADSPSLAMNATHCYIGTMPCGCDVAVVVDMPDDAKSTADSVRRFIADGYTVRRVPIADLKDGTVKLGRCIHRG